MGLNVRLMRMEIARQSDRTIRPIVEKAVKLDFEVKKEGFMEFFDGHEVTKELRSGPDAKSSIPTVAKTGGNLFSLLGFYAEQKPVTALRAYLKKSVKIGDTRRGQLKGNWMVFETPVAIPTQEEVDGAMSSNPETGLEWTDRPFTSLLANGVSGLPKYLFNLAKSNSGGFSASRSGPAIQTKSTLRAGSTGPIPYISEVLGYLKRLIGPQK